MRMCDLALEAGLPAGFLNYVSGEGAVVGEVLGLSMDVDVLVFTGSGVTGRRLMEYAARSNMKRVYLELGGKSPNIIFADAPDLDEAADFVCQVPFSCHFGSLYLFSELSWDPSEAVLGPAWAISVR